VLFVFVVMMLNLGQATTAQEKRWFTAETWAWPAGLSFLLALAVVWLLASGQYDPQTAITGTQVVDAKLVGISLFGPYLLLVELASLLLLAALVAAYHLGRNTDGFNDPIAIRDVAAETTAQIKEKQLLANNLRIKGIEMIIPLEHGLVISAILFALGFMCDGTS